MDEKRTAYDMENRRMERKKKHARLVTRNCLEIAQDGLLTWYSSSSRAFPLAAAICTLIYNALTAALCTYLPRDSLIIGYGASCYAIAGCVFSLLGVYGIIAVGLPVQTSPIHSPVHVANTALQRQPNLTTTFSHFLLLDAFVSSIARLLILELFFNTTHSQDACTDVVEALWTNQQQPSHATVRSSQWQQSLTEAGIWCRFALGTVHVVCVGVLVCTSAAQGTVAVAIRSVGKQFGRQRSVGAGHGPVEVVPVHFETREKR